MHQTVYVGIKYSFSCFLILPVNLIIPSFVWEKKWPFLSDRERTKSKIQNFEYRTLAKQFSKRHMCSLKSWTDYSFLQGKPLPVLYLDMQIRDAFLQRRNLRCFPKEPNWLTYWRKGLLRTAAVTSGRSALLRKPSFFYRVEWDIFMPCALCCSVVAADGDVCAYIRLHVTIHTYMCKQARCDALENSGRRYASVHYWERVYK